MEIARRFRLVKHFPDLDSAGSIGYSPVDGVSLLVAEDGGADLGTHRMLAGTAVRVFWVNQSHFDLFVVQLQQGPSVPRDDIARYLLRFDDDGPFKLMFEFNDGRPLLARDQVLEPGLVDLRDVDPRGVSNGAFAQTLQIAPLRYGKGLQGRCFALKLKAATQEGVQRARVIRMNLGDEFLGPHVEERQFHAFADRSGTKLSAPLAAVADDQNYLAIRAGLDQTDKTYRRVMPVIGHEEPAALVEQMGQDRQLRPIDGLLDGTGNMTRVAQIAGDALILQPVHQRQC